MKPKIQKLYSKTTEVFLRYPTIIAVALIAAISAVIGIEMDNYFDSEHQFQVGKLIIISTIGISAMFAVKMLSQRIGKGFLLESITAILLISFYFVLPKTKTDFTIIHFILLVVIYILSHLLVSFIAFLGKDKELNFWQYNKNLFINIFLTVVFTGVLVGGFLLAILAVEQLFNFNFNGQIYPKTFVFLAILGSTLIFLIFNDRGLPNLENDENYPQILKFFTQFVLVPLLFIYLVILYFYTGKILINWELPRGWVSYLVLAYSIVGILALLLVHPLKNDSGKSWVKIFSSLFYFSLLPLIILLFTAIFTRILEYGYTEPRYFVLLIAIWLTTVVFYFIIWRKPSIKFIPKSLFLFGLFALVFPYFNAFSVAKRSQKHELEKILKEQNILENGVINFNKKIKSNTANDIADKFSFLNQRFEDDYLLAYLDNKSKKELNNALTKRYEYNVKYTIKDLFSQKEVEKTNPSIFRIFSKNKWINIGDYTYLIPIKNTNYLDNEEVKINDDVLKINSNLGGFSHPKMTISLNGETLDLMPFIKSKLDQQKEGDKIEDEISTNGRLGNYDIKIVFEELKKTYYEKDNRTIYTTYDVSILIK